MGSITWSRDLAEVYDATYSAMFDPSVLDPTATPSTSMPSAISCSVSPQDSRQ
jgi:hypothetical protein